MPWKPPPLQTNQYESGFTPKPHPCGSSCAVSRGVHRILLTPGLPKIRGSRGSRVSRVKPRMSFGIQRSLKKRKIKTWTSVSCNERKSLLQKSVWKSPWPKNKNTSMRISSETSWAFWPVRSDVVVLEKPFELSTIEAATSPALIDLKSGFWRKKKKSNCYLHDGSKKKKKKKVKHR